MWLTGCVDRAPPTLVQHFVKSAFLEAPDWRSKLEAAQFITAKMRPERVPADARQAIRRRVRGARAGASERHG
jgi:hypothetical protein